ncbi:hypothetical protein [Yersinia pestis]|uniref:Conserved domain protein n=1 Tax=Yersinia pestis Java 9 TaxID=880632 RepID=E8PSD6_YERPE|nr:hypothetical protein [Yersinia pestis]ADW66936.1 conserved domain protein [Yersinia pestis Java 9]
MKKIMIALVLGCFLTGCTATNPPEAPQAKGGWQIMNTSVNDITKGY